MLITETKTFCTVITIACMMLATYYFANRSYSKSDTVLTANIEALAAGEIEFGDWESIYIDDWGGYYCCESGVFTCPFVNCSEY